METAPPTRLTILVDHPENLLAAGIIRALEHEQGIAVRQADHAQDGVDILITDYAGGMHLAAHRRTRPPTDRGAPSRLMVLTSHDREYEVRQALEAGIHGYLLTNCQTDELVRCVRTLGTGARYISMAVAQRMADSMSREALTAREIEVLRLLMHGQCNKSIASGLDIAVGTVKAHVKAIMAKLDARSRTHAVTVASARGLVQGSMETSMVRPSPASSPSVAAAAPRAHMLA